MTSELVESRFCRDPFWVGQISIIFQVKSNFQDDFRPLRNSSIPAPTECFSHTVLVGLPCLYFWILLPVLVLQLRLSRRSTLPWSILMSMKCFTICLTIIDRLFVLFISLFDQVGTLWISKIFIHPLRFSDLTTCPQSISYILA